MEHGTLPQDPRSPYQGKVMTTLTINARGQGTLRKELLDHLGVKPGDRIDVNLLPSGKASIEAERKGKPIEHIFGLLKRDGERPLSLDEIDEIIKGGWANLR
jgi:antitoxin PrlF